MKIFDTVRLNEKRKNILKEEERIKEELGYSIENANKINDFVKSLPMSIKKFLLTQVFNECLNMHLLGMLKQ